MSLYIPKNASYNLRQVLDIINSTYSKQAKINAYLHSDNIYSDNHAAFPEITNFYNAQLLPPVVGTILSIVALPFIPETADYQPALTALTTLGFLSWTLNIASDIDFHFANQIKKYNTDIKTVLEKHFSDEYSALEVTNLINILEKNHSYFSSDTFSEEEILATFVNHELQYIKPQLLSDQHSTDILHITWPYAVLNDTDISTYA